MKGLQYILTLLEPILANILVSDPNTAHSMFYIPGGLVRGAAIHAYTGKKDAKEDTFRRLFLDGRTRYLNAYPLINEKRALPSPVTWQEKRKPQIEDTRIVYNGLQDDIETKGIHFDFWTLDDQGLHALEEQWQVNVHTQRDAKKGHATSNAGAVYRYIALPAGMQLQGAVLVENESDISEIKKMFSGTIFLGKSRTASYGSAAIEFHPLDPGWSEYDFKGIQPSQKFTLTLLSPALVRDINGQYSVDIQTALKARLGMDLEIKKKFCRPEIVGGFNRTWGMPLPQAVSIAAGSIFEVETETEVSIDILQTLEETGIGERRAEGFGRLAINISIPSKMEWSGAYLNLKLPQSTPSLTEDLTARLMLTRVTRQQLDHQILAAARQAVVDYEKNKVPNSQLTRWRVVLRDALSKQNENDPIERVKRFCRDCQGKTGWDKMSKARVGIGKEKPRLTAWIETLLDEPRALDVALQEGYWSEVKLGAITLKMDAFNAEYRLRLLDTMLAMMVKKNSEGGKNG